MSEEIPILVAARLKSKRLPRKAVLKLFDKPLIIKLIERLKKSKKTDKIIVCTSRHEDDSELCTLLEKHKVMYYRGDELDVLSRFINVAKNLNATTIVRVTADNPLTDPGVMDEMIESHLDLKSEYTFAEEIPDGAESEIIQTSLLVKCHDMIQDKTETEYMSWFLNRPDYFDINKYKIINKALRRRDITITVDIKKDFVLVEKIFNHFQGNPGKLEQIIEHYDDLPIYLKRNKSDLSSVMQKNKVNINFHNDN